MRILVTFAIDAEFAPWRSHHAFVPYEFENWERRREFDLHKANIGNTEVAVIITGMGRENATRAMESIPLAAHDLLISTGLAGSLDGNLKPGDIVVAISAKPLGEAKVARSDAPLVNLATSSGARAVNVSLTSDKIIATGLEKEELATSGSIVEMESAHILSAAALQGVPAVVIRAVSDSADEDLPVNFEKIADSRGHVKVGGLLKEVALHPYKIGPLVRFGRQSRAAAESLADFLDRYIPALSANARALRRVNEEEMTAT
jgi:adenosylhomocysteine nucleosidase